MNINERPSENLILWAVDPFQTETKPDLEVVRELQRWAKAADLKIRPVYVLSVSRAEYGVEDENSWALRYLSGAEQSTLRFVKDLGVSDALPPKVLFGHSSSLKNSAHLLLEYAQEVHAKMIVVSSQGRSGLGRLVFGSFAESLISKSFLPILFLTHFAETRAERQNRVLFPTDFSDNSKQAFDLFLSDAKSLSSEVVLFHEVVFPVLATSGISAGGAAWIPESYMKEQVSWANKEGAAWIKRAEYQGVACRCIVQEDTQNVPKSILELAEKEKVRMIALASHSGPVSSVMVGSVAREIFRSNEYPVWACGPHAKYPRTP